MGKKISKEWSSRYKEIAEEEIRLDELNNKGYFTATDIFIQLFIKSLSRYGHNDEKHKKNRLNLEKLLKRTSDEMKLLPIQESNIGYRGTWFHEKVWKKVISKQTVK